MIIISSGFPKSASTLLFLYTEHLLESSGNSSGQKVFRKYNTEGFTPHFGFFNSAWYVLLSMIGPVVIKTHSGPTFFVRFMIRLRLAVAYYSIRDPRDAVLSAMDHAAKARTSSQPTPSDVAFAPFKTWDDVYPAFNMHFQRYGKWKLFGKVLFVRYEELMQNADRELRRITEFIGRKKLDKYIPSTIAWFDSRKKQTLNFNKGDVSRFRNELTAEETEKLEREMRACILSMNYTLTAGE